MRPVRFSAIALALTLAAAPAFAQQSLSAGADGIGVPYTLRGGIAITQNGDLAVTGAGVACAITGQPITTENSYFRVFELSSVPNLPASIDVASVDFGIGAVNLANVPSLMVDTDVILYTIPAGTPTDAGFARTDLTEVARTTYTVMDGQANGVVTATFAGAEVFASTDRMVVEWATPNGNETKGEEFGMRLGGNDGGESGPTFISTETSCGGIPPTPVTSLGTFTNSQWVVVVNVNAASAVEGGATGFSIRLGDAAPNPSATGATIPYTLETASAARVSVYDVLGREVAVLADGAHAAGAHTAQLAAGQLPAGTYVVRLQTATASVAQRLTVTR